MSKSRSNVSARHLVIHRLDSSVPFPALARCLESHLEVRPELGLFLDPSEGLIRVGGIDLHGDLLIRMESPGRDSRLLVACRHGDRAALDALMVAMDTLWKRSDRAPSAREGLGLLNFLQTDAVVACLDRVLFAERTLEDAFSCRFSAVDALRREIVGLHSRALLPLRMLELIAASDACLIHLESLHAPSVILHQGKRVVLCLRERVEARGGRSLVLHYSYHPATRTCLVGALTERRSR